jgi:hypothetical protein
MAQEQIFGLKPAARLRLNKSMRNMPTEYRTASIEADHAMILPSGANPEFGWNFRKGHPNFRTDPCDTFIREAGATIREAGATVKPE